VNRFTPLTRKAGYVSAAFNQLEAAMTKYKGEPKRITLKADHTFSPKTALPAGMQAFTSGAADVGRWSILDMPVFMSTDNPSLVLITTRFDNAELSVSDNFAVIVTKTTRNNIEFNLWRVDNDEDPSINYRFGFLIVE
jgi:hypothetical protein